MHTHLLVPVLLYAFWALLLVLSLGLWRTIQVVRGTHRANEFTAGVPHGADLYWRLNRAHMNTVENLPIFASVVVAGALMGAQHAAVEPLVWGVLALRVAQTTVHLSSGSAQAVVLRATCFFAQCLGLSALVILLVGVHA
jgi:uncharacterized MAPEG superfamily protein